MTGNDYGQAFDGMAKLAMVGLFAIVAAVVAAIVGVPCLLWWAWHHVSIH